MDNENASKINALGLTSMMLSALTLVTLGGFLALVFELDILFDFSWYYDHSEFSYWFSPLFSILNIIVAIFARKRGSVKQKKVANVCIAVGILGIIIYSGIMLYGVYWWSFIYSG